MVLDLNKHITVDDNRNPFHSSGYAQVANGTRIGSISNLTFEQRQQIDKNRKVIDGYRRSNIGNAYAGLRARTVTDVPPRGNLPPSGGNNPYA